MVAYIVEDPHRLVGVFCWVGLTLAVVERLPDTSWIAVVRGRSLLYPQTAGVHNGYRMTDDGCFGLVEKQDKLLRETQEAAAVDLTWLTELVDEVEG